MNPPSAWAVAKRDAPKVAEDCWHFPCPAGPKGRYIPYNYCFYGVWAFGQNKTAAKELVAVPAGAPAGARSATPRRMATICRR